MRLFSDETKNFEKNLAVLVLLEYPFVWVRFFSILSRDFTKKKEKKERKKEKKKKKRKKEKKM